MEDPCSPLTWVNYYQEEGIEDLKHSFVYTSLELEATVLAAHEEIARKEDELSRLKELLNNMVKERDEAQTRSNKLVIDNQILQQKLFQEKLIKQRNNCRFTNMNEDEPRSSNSNCNSGFSSSDCDEIMNMDHGLNPISQTMASMLEGVEELVHIKKPLPEKGKFLQAVVEAGPLLQTLLLAGPLPQWQHPPPQLNSIEIPPVTITSPTTSRIQQQDSCFSKKRGHSDSFPNTTKFQKLEFTNYHH